MWIVLSDKGRFAYDESGVLVVDSAFIMLTTFPKYLCAILNSDIVRWYMQNLAPTSGMGALQWKKAYVEHLPIPLARSNNRDRLIPVVEQILYVKQANPHADTSYLEDEMNSRVNRLYGVHDCEAEAIK